MAPVWMLAVYRVKDAAAAAASYELSKDTRRAAGQRSYRVFRITSGAPVAGEEQIAILGDWDDPSQFSRFRETPEFAKIMEGLGALGPPEVTVMQQLVPLDEVLGAAGGAAPAVAQ